MKLPPALSGAPLISDWIAFEADGGVELRTGRVELGQGAVTAILQIAAAELGLDPRNIRVVSGDTSRTPNEGPTVGSLSIAQGGAAAALAGSAARRVILAEAARRLNVAADDLSVADGTILADGVPTDLMLATLGAEVDLAQPIEDHAQPGTNAGPDLARIDLPGRVLGSPFVNDMSGSDTLFGRVLHPPARHARLISLDTEALETRAGVVRIVRNGDAIGMIGDSKAAVDAAISAAEALADWHIPEPQTGDLRETLRKRSLTDGTSIIARGDSPDAGDIEVVATRGYVSHGSIGPASALALWRDGHLTVDSPSQNVFALRSALAQVFGLDEAAVTVRHAPGAGCYGHNGTDDAAADAAFLARAVPGRPVHVTWSRRDDFASGPTGAAMACRVRLGLTKGQVSDARITVASPPHSSRPGTGGAPCLATASRFDPPFPFPDLTDVPVARGGGADRNATPYYAIPNLTVDKVLVHDLPLRTSSLRGLGAHLNTYAIELAIDAAARQAGADPVAFRLAHLDDPRARDVIESVAGGGLPEATETTAWGLGFGRYKNTAAYCAVAVEVAMDTHLSVRRARVALDTGRIINRDGTLNQVEGGLLQAISWTLFEEVPLSGAAVAATGWDDYPILRFSDVPQDVSIDLIDRPDDPPMGCAEALQGPTAAAIGTAARALFGQPLPDLPLTRDRIAASLT